MQQTTRKRKTLWKYSTFRRCSENYSSTTWCFKLFLLDDYSRYSEFVVVVVVVMKKKNEVLRHFKEYIQK